VLAAVGATPEAGGVACGLVMECGGEAGLNGAAKGLRVGVPEIVGFGGEGANAGRVGEGANGGLADGPNPGGNLGVDGAASEGVAAGCVRSGFEPRREPGGPRCRGGEAGDGRPCPTWGGSFGSRWCWAGWAGGLGRGGLLSVA
jgi:hypothetical protein